MGRLNLLAAAELYKELDPEVIVFAYGNMSKYLKDTGAPSESRAIADEFVSLLAQDEIIPRIEVFKEGQWRVRQAGTGQEVHNIMHLAVERGIPEVVLLTITAHSERSLLAAQRHQLTEPMFAGLNVRAEKSELVLLRKDWARYAGRIHRVFGSQSYIRTLINEQFGVNELLKGNYTPITS